MNVLSHPSHGKSRCYIISSWTCFSLLKMFHLSSMRLLKFWPTGEELAGFQNPLWFLVLQSSGPLMGHWSNRPSRGFSMARWAQVWMVVELSEERTRMWTAESWPEKLAMLCCAIHLWKGCFVSPMFFFGTDVYIGETKHPLHNRMARHGSANSSGQDSAVHFHLKEKNHSFEDNNVKILAREDGLKED